jgi:hypothetical protein
VDFVNELKVARHKRAVCLVQKRRALREIGFKGANLDARRTTREVACRADPVSLRRYAQGLWGYVVAPTSPIGNEYYSCCGAEDAVCERKEYAREVALSIWRSIGRF